MKAYLNTVWTVAQREIVAVLRTKGFWSISVAGPILVGLPLYIMWFVALPLFNDVKAQIEEDIKVSEVFNEVFGHQLGVVRNFLWGDPLNYYVIDRTGQLSDSIRQEIYERERRRFIRGHGHGPETIEEFHEWVENYPSLVEMVSDLSLHKFQEIQEPNVSIETVNGWLETGKIAGYFILPDDFLFSNQGAQFVRPDKLNRAQARKLDELKHWFEDIATSVRRQAILNVDNNIGDSPTAELNSLNIEIRRVVPAHQLSSTLAETHEQAHSSRSALPNWVKAATIPYVYFFITVLSSASNLVLTNTVEEKSTKVAELIVANSNPSQILDGKLLGGMVVVLLPILAFCLINGPPIVGVLGSLAGYESTTFAEFLHPGKLLNWFLFLLLAFTFYGYIQSALGSLCNDMKDTAITLYPITFINTFGMLPAVVFVMFAPDGKIAQVLSFVPFLTPSVMVSRSASLPDWPVYILVVMVMCASILIVRKFSTTLFAHGMLSEHTPGGFQRILKLASRPV
ncbi:MAG: hypothetical protein F4Z01_10390 [Gammaproteobacteria bacterium]|nr:hypothetical protein [Gammaproteobacteria bacterium]MYF37652.1 hypothetical protein [Gammaproteobacteria bacterium]